MPPNSKPRSIDHNLDDASFDKMSYGVEDPEVGKKSGNVTYAPLRTEQGVPVEHSVRSSRRQRACAQIRRGCRYVSFVFVGIFMWVFLALLFGKSLPFSRSNFVLFGKIELSDQARWFHPNSPLYWNGVKTPQGKMDCDFDFSSKFHEGGQGILYKGICQNKHRRDSVVFKYLKGWRPILWEGSATRVIGQITNYRYYASGWNYLIVAELQHYNTLQQDMPEVKDWQDFIFQELTQISRQLRYLNQDFFHLDMWWPNVLYRPVGVNDTSVTYLDDEHKGKHKHHHVAEHIIHHIRGSTSSDESLNHDIRKKIRKHKPKWMTSSSSSSSSDSSFDGGRRLLKGVVKAFNLLDEISFLHPGSSTDKQEDTLSISTHNEPEQFGSAVLADLAPRRSLNSNADPETDDEEEDEQQPSPKQEWEFQLIDFTMALPHSMHSHAVVHHNDVSRRRAPYVVCMKKRLSSEEKEYCSSPSVKQYLDKLCYGIIDIYPLASNALRLLHMHRGGEDILQLEWHTSLNLAIEVHRSTLEIISSMREAGDVRADLLDLFESLLDLPHLDTDLVCPGPV